ncbi:MAG: biotin transporter BioY [Armatimonadota bacterium]
MHDRTTVATQTQERPLVLQLGLELGLAGAFCAATVLAAHLRIPLPFTPVPLTLQTLVVLLAGGLLGPRLGFVSQTGYLLLGLLGLPVLATVSILGPTGGYVLGFVRAAVLMGLGARRQTLGWTVAGAVLATLTIYACGSLWLSAYTGQSLSHALALGVAPFLAGDALKGAAAVMIIRVAAPRMPRVL